MTMQDPVKLGIIICDRYRTCAGGRCLRALRCREGAFSIYRDKEVVVGTHPIPEGYYRTHQELGTWAAPQWKPLLEPTLVGQQTRRTYDSSL